MHFFLVQLKHWGLQRKGVCKTVNKFIEKPKISHFLFCVCFNIFTFNWRIIALQCCVAFYQTSARISCRYIYVPSLPPPSPSHPSRLLQSPGLSSLPMSSYTNLVISSHLAPPQSSPAFTISVWIWRMFLFPSPTFHWHPPSRMVSRRHTQA